MLEARLKARIPSARFETTATLSGYQLAFHKRSLDGSGKCNIVYTGQDKNIVLGVVYEIAPDDRIILDQIEGLGKGYDHIELQVNVPSGSISTFAYIADAQYIDDSLKPYTWYKAFVVNGAKSHGFPENYIRQLENVSTMKDPDASRLAENEQFLNRNTI